MATKLEGAKVAGPLEEELYLWFPLLNQIGFTLVYISLHWSSLHDKTATDVKSPFCIGEFSSVGIFLGNTYSKLHINIVSVSKPK